MYKPIYDKNCIECHIPIYQGIICAKCWSKAFEDFIKNLFLNQNVFPNDDWHKEDHIF